MSTEAERIARTRALKDLRRMMLIANSVLRELNASAPGYAGIVEAVKESIENAIKVVSGVSPE